MAVWDALPGLADQLPFIQDFADIWQAADKVVYSTTLETMTTRRTRLERTFDPDAVERMKAAASRDLIGGPELAGHALRARLVDVCGFLITPVLVGGGRRWMPRDMRIGLERSNHSPGRTSSSVGTWHVRSAALVASMPTCRIASACGDHVAISA